jgi:hypothetical protein
MSICSSGKNQTGNIISGVFVFISVRVTLQALWSQEVLAQFE